MDNLENVENEASVNTELPSTEEKQDSTNIDIPEVVEEELTDEQLKEEITRLQEEVIKEEDPKEKRHKEQDIGWKQKLVKEREKAFKETERAKELEETNQKFESTIVDDAYEKTVDENYGLPYFEKLYKSNPDIANKVAGKGWDMSAKQLIYDTKKLLADGGDEELKTEITNEELRTSIEQDVYHKISIEQADSIFETLEGTEKDEAKTYFDDIVEGKKLTPTTAKKYAEMATFYATRNSKPDKPNIDKERILADQANTGITPKSGSKETEVGDTNAIRQQLINAGISPEQVNLMYPLN